jgi:hypothetical protein
MLHHVVHQPGKPPLSLPLLAAFSKMYGVIDSYTEDGDNVRIKRLGASYRVDAVQAAELLLRMLRERPPLAELALRMCAVDQRPPSPGQGDGAPDHVAPADPPSYR